MKSEMKTIDTQVIQDIIDNTNDDQCHLIIDAIQQAIKSKFLKGEIVEVSNGDGWYLRYFEYYKSGGFYTSNASNDISYWKECRKLNSILINLTPHKSPKRPEGVKGDDVIIYHYTGDPIKENYIEPASDIEDWTLISGYQKIHFLGGEL